MSGSSFGSLLKISSWGESHGPSIGVVIQGCPSGISIKKSEIQKELDRRKPGQSSITSKRKESDQIQIESGIFDGKTTGTPICLLVKNTDAKSKDYKNIKNTYRPSHADYTYDAKYGFRDYRGGGRASARETIARVAAGAVAKKILKKSGIEIIAYVKQVHQIKAVINVSKVTSDKVESNILRCPSQTSAKKMIELIKKVGKQGDSVGGVIECVIRNVPAGLGSPVFNKLDARLAKAMLSIPAVKGFEVGDGFSAINLKGSQHNDVFITKNKKIITKTNHAGGIIGGISSGSDIIFRVAFKPTATIFKKQQTLTSKGEKTQLQVIGRHDPCVVPRAVPIVEAMAALVLADEYLIQKSVRA